MDQPLANSQLKTRIDSVVEAWVTDSLAGTVQSSYTNSGVTIQTGGVGAVQGLNIVSFDDNLTTQNYNLKTYTNGKTKDLTVQRLRGGIVYSTVIGEYAKALMHDKLVVKNATAEGISLSGSALATQQRARSRINSIEDMSVVTMYVIEEVWLAYADELIGLSEHEAPYPLPGVRYDIVANTNLSGFVSTLRQKTADWINASDTYSNVLESDLESALRSLNIVNSLSLSAEVWVLSDDIDRNLEIDSLTQSSTDLSLTAMMTIFPLFVHAYVRKTPSIELSQHFENLSTQLKRLGYKRSNDSSGIFRDIQSYMNRLFELTFGEPLSEEIWDIWNRRIDLKRNVFSIETELDDDFDFGVYRHIVERNGRKPLHEWSLVPWPVQIFDDHYIVGGLKVTIRSDYIDEADAISYMTNQTVDLNRVVAISRHFDLLLTLVLDVSQTGGTIDLAGKQNIEIRNVDQMLASQLQPEFRSSKPVYFIGK